jgi:DeoR family glycerol-3-phosphate regulon repressor
MQLKIRLAALSRSNVYVADHSKIGAVGRYPGISFSEIETFVTDQPLEEPFVPLLTEVGASVLSVAGDWLRGSVDPTLR